MKSRYTVEFSVNFETVLFSCISRRMDKFHGTCGIRHESTWHMRAKCHGVGLHEKGVWCEGHL